MPDHLPEGELPGASRPERMFTAAALIDQALICLRSHPQEAEMRLRSALKILGVGDRRSDVTRATIDAALQD